MKIKIVNKQWSELIRKPSFTFFPLMLALFLFMNQQGYSQTTTYMTIPQGSFIVNMGVTPQTINNGLKPYGLLYALLQANCPVYWVINPSKIKDGTDFSYNGTDFKGGPFIIDAQYRSAAVDAIISNWVAQGVVGITNTSPIYDVPVFLTFWNLPSFTMDLKNGSIAVKFFVNAGIPASAYGGASSNWKNPADLDCCDDIFVMPHADPIWLTHGRLYTWNEECKGAIWLGCHAGSALEDMFKNTAPVDHNLQTNFLAEKTGPAIGGGPYYQNALILWGNHSNGTPPYSYDHPTDPIMQFMGTIDAATQNGSEQIFIPLAPGWRPTTKVGVYDPDHLQRASNSYEHRPAIVAWGPGFGESDRGVVMLEASHDISKLGNNPASVAAQRAFFNFAFYTSSSRSEAIPSIADLPPIIFSGEPQALSVTFPVGIDPDDYSIQWSASCGGVFSPNSTSQSVSFTPDATPSPTNCQIAVTVTDVCGRVTFDTESVTVTCNLGLSSSVTNPCYNTPNGGAITVTVSSGSAPYAYSWTRTEGGSGSGSAPASPFTITNLQAGSYTVNVSENGGCSASFNVTLSQSPQIIITATPTPVTCNGGSTGSISTSVSGGIPGFTYAWTKIGVPGFSASTANLSGLSAGTYNLTVTDSKGCVETKEVVVTQPDDITITPSVTNVTCKGFNNGQISLSVSGGNPGYTYLWNDGNSNQNRTGLAPGSYSVTVTDSKNCTKTLSGIEVTEPAAALTVVLDSKVDVECFGQSTGAINITASGGTGSYSYSWTGPGGFTSDDEDLSSLAAGNYSLTVTDAKNCTASLQVTIGLNPAMVLSTTPTSPTCPPDGDQNFADGAITLTVSGGAGSYTFDWADIGNPGEFTDPQNRTNLMAGTYTVTVKDANNCTATTSVTLNYLNPNPVQPSSIGQ
ncbi:MAG: SprB repeat-containing protein [Bacteroidales bacterium]|nr:SprB repeat-containing protein [Bacteroidales bacterium]